MDATADSLIGAFDHVWGRLNSRLEGLTDEEYRWAPVTGGWSVHEVSDGQWRLDGGADGGPAPDPVPVPTIAWRIGHLAGIGVGNFASRRFNGVGLLQDQLAVPRSASAVPGFLDQHYQAWRSGLAALTPQEWAAPLGPAWGPYAEANTVDLALHVLDEVIHHAAEVALIRDLYSRRDSLRD